MFQKSYFEYCLCKHSEDMMSKVDSFCCPACQPDMLAVCCDDNRKHYRFRKSRGTEEPSLYEGLFIAKDEEVLTFLEKIRGSSGARANDSGTCGVSRFRASKETSNKSSSKIDEEGIQTQDIIACPEPLPWRNLRISNVYSKGHGRDGKCYLLRNGCYLQVLALPKQGG
ncbi:hypothetical protein PO909_033940 [Leuciscus waleckii]